MKAYISIFIILAILISLVVYSFYTQTLLNIKFSIIKNKENNVKSEHYININNIVFIRTYNINLTVNITNPSEYYSSKYIGILSLNVTQNTILLFNLSEGYITFIKNTPSNWKNITFCISYNSNLYYIGWHSPNNSSMLLYYNIFNLSGGLYGNLTSDNYYLLVPLPKGYYNITIFFGIQGFIPQQSIIPLFTINNTIVDYANITLVN
ncbi:hypothetical protein SJAV_03040 [Sulfurisphaera javensis]|uniref:Uncharacterized protein n=1 Tax=Sulfurisphaera javensis TaxID=2049879 RepID=A0AAT9GN96_9CREN